MSDRDGIGARLPTRRRLAWWLFLAGLGVVTAFVVGSFVGIVVLGVFGYYATRPICDRLQQYVSQQVAAALTVLAVLVPVLLLVAVAGLRVVTRVQQLGGDHPIAALVTRIIGIGALPDEQQARLVSFLQNPTTAIDFGGAFWSNVGTAVSALQGVLGAMLLLALATTLTFALLGNDRAMSGKLVDLFGGRDSTAYAYAVAVDRDLESVFFGNLLFAIVMGVVATATYAVTNLVAPGDLQVPMVVVLGFLTGVASLIPIVVGKVVYVPVVALLGFQALQSGSAELAFVGVVLVVYVLVLDILPQSFIQPYLSGQRLDPMLLLFAYLLGPILFGWYGFFLMPILFVLVLEAIRIVLPELLHGDAVRPERSTSENAGAAYLEDVAPTQREEVTPDPPDGPEKRSDEGADPESDTDADAS